ncbi:microtubule-associated protein 10 [Heterocephalus glaber]|uniref:Microtubule-associated protein 10 n=1 Tax=Heterocephalus glaber TaxID=10181 RepID=A0AAX6PLV6_HETGA|nr:microtubule-associated protein 10 [Heterocephalus glaber]
MAAVEAERLFSLELLVDWVRLEAGPSSPGAPCPAVSFCLLDFPPLLVHPPATPVPGSQRDVIGFGRGKACLFRLHPAAPRCLLLRAALLQLPAGRAPTPRLLGACDVQLADVGVARLGAQSRRGTFALLSRTGERIGDLALFYRLTDLGSCQLGSLEPLVPLASSSGAEGTVVGRELQRAPYIPREKRRPSSAPELRPRDADQTVGALAGRQDGGMGGVFCSKNTSDTASFVKSLRTCSTVAPVAGSSVNPLNEEVAELDFETNTFCPPPLYYTHLTPKKTPPARVKIITEPQMNVPVELDGAFPEKSLVNSPLHPSPLKLTNSATQERATVLVSPPPSQDTGASNQTTCPQIDQNTINTIRQLPLLNALLIELSLLYNQPMASPTDVHPHLAWLYRTQDQVPESYAKSTESESKKHQLSVGEHKKSASFQCKKNQIEKLKKDKYFEKSSGNSQIRVTRRRLLYGLTNTLRLRLKQTNPDMLVVQEKREHYRKMQAQMLGTKCRITPSKVKKQSFAEQSHQPQLPKNNCLDRDASLVENSNTSRQISGGFDEPSTTKETKLKQATEERTVDCGQNRTKNGLLEGIVSPENSIIPERFTHTNTLGGKLEKSVQNPYVFQPDAVDRTLDKEIDGGQVKSTDSDVLGADKSENRPSKNSFYESISELKYSDDFTSPCYSEDFHTTEDTSRSLISLQAHDNSSKAKNPKHGSYTSKSSEARLSIRKNSSEKSSILSPPFSAGSPVLSKGRSYFSKNQDRSLEETSSISTGNLSSSHSIEKENQMDQNGMHNSKIIKNGHGVAIKAGTSLKSLERSHSPRTSQLSSYLPSNLSELELKVLDNSTSDHFGEDDDDIGPLSISKQCKDICELVINKLPGYTV